MPETTQGSRHILVMMDHFSKWCEAFPTRDPKASNVAKIFVARVFSRFGPPAVLHSDQGRNFDTTLMHEIYGIMGIKKSRATAYHPQGDAQVERQNRTLQEIIANFVPRTNMIGVSGWIRQYLHTTQVYILQLGSPPRSLSLVPPSLAYRSRARYSSL